MVSCRVGRGKLSRAVSLASFSPGYQNNYFASSTYFKLSEYEEDVSVINMIQVKFSCFLCHKFHILSCKGGGKLSRAINLPPPTWVSK